MAPGTQLWSFGAEKDGRSSCDIASFIHSFIHPLHLKPIQPPPPPPPPRRLHATHIQSSSSSIQRFPIPHSTLYSTSALPNPRLSSPSSLTQHGISSKHHQIRRHNIPRHPHRKLHPTPPHLQPLPYNFNSNLPNSSPLLTGHLLQPNNNHPPFPCPPPFRLLRRPRSTRHPNPLHHLHPHPRFHRLVLPPRRLHPRPRPSQTPLSTLHRPRRLCCGSGRRVLG